MDEERNLIRRLMTQNTVWIVTLGVLLFVPAGSVDWPAAWLFLATLGVLGIIGGFWFVKINPGLLTERMRPMIQKDQPKADKVFILVMGLVSMIWLIVMGLDQRYQWSGMGAGFQVLGFVLFILSLAISLGDAGKQIRSAGSEDTGRARTSRDPHRPLHARQASDV